jgi:hypothetical protein
MQASDYNAHVGLDVGIGINQFAGSRTGLDLMSQ